MEWAPLAAATSVEEAPYPAQWRRAITDEMHAEGVDCIVVSDRHKLSKDFLMNVPLWGIVTAAYRNGYRLWRIVGAAEP
jgi:hypothetical protein